MVVDEAVDDDMKVMDWCAWTVRVPQRTTPLDASAASNVDKRQIFEAGSYAGPDDNIVLSIPEGESFPHLKLIEVHNDYGDNRGYSLGELTFAPLDQPIRTLKDKSHGYRDEDILGRRILGWKDDGKQNKFSLNEYTGRQNIYFEK